MYPRKEYMPSCRVQRRGAGSYEGWVYCSRPSAPDASVLDWPICDECLEAVR